MFPLSALDSYGPEVAKVVEGHDGFALAIIFPGRLVVPCGDAAAITAAGPPVRRWRLMVGDAGPCDAVLGGVRDGANLTVHVQRFMQVDPGAVPTAADVPDPGLRPANLADLDGLGELAVQLHVDDQFGPHPGRSGQRSYQQRMREAVERGSVWVVGPIGAPVAKVERSVSSARWGVQLSGVVVTPAARRRGLGRAMMAAAVRQALRVSSATPITLHVREANTAAIRSYEACGFRDVEEWRLALRG